MKNKIRYEIWKIKNNVIYKILFQVKKMLFKTENGIKKSGNEAINMIKEIIMVLFYIFVISILVIGLLIVEEVLYNNFFVNCEMVKSIVTFSEDYFYQLLLASLGISGVLIALFYANLSGVFSSKYVNLDTSLSFEILREKENNRNIKSIKNYIIINIILIMFCIVGIRLSYLITGLFVLYTVRIVIAFINLSQRIFYFTNLNFITREECLKIYNSSRKVQKTKGYFRGVEFEQYYQNIAKGSIEKLNKLIETFIKEKDYNAIYKFEDTTIRTLYNYMVTKNKIPYNSLWFEEKYKQKSMLKMGEMELVTYVNTGVIPTPEKIRNINWIEENFFSLISIGLEELIRNDKLIYAYKIMEKLDKLLTAANLGGNISNIIKEEIMIFEKINTLFNYSEKNDFNIQAILEMESLFFMGAILKSNVYIQKCKEIIDKMKYKEIKFNNLLKKNNKIFNNEKVEKVCKQIELERRIEGKVITSERYIKEHLYALIYQQINEIYNVYIQILDYIQNSVQNMYENKKYNATKVIIAKNIEIYNKVENAYLSIERIHKEIIKMKKDFIWIDNIPKKFNEKIKDYKLNNIICAIKLLGNLEFDKKEEDESQFDIFGLIFYNAYIMANNLLNNDDYERYKKIFNYLFILSNISDIKTKTEIELNGYNAQYAINKYLKPYLYFMDIQGKMIYLSRINSDSKWEDLVKEQNYSIENKKFFNSMVEYGNIDKNRIEFDPFRDSMNRNFIDNIMPKIKTENIGDIYGRKRIISDDEIVQKFELGKYNFSEIYLCYYVNNLSDSKYESKFKWNEG